MCHTRNRATAPSDDSMSSPFGPFTCTAQLGRVVMDRLSGEGLFDERPMTQLSLGRFRFGRCPPLAQLEPLRKSGYWRAGDQIGFIWYRLDKPLRVQMHRVSEDLSNPPALDNYSFMKDCNSVTNGCDREQVV